ncbi:hypothetical protein SUGI_0629630 [Cryptomeria japonica]|nr:hypothetical protein SUGI_0629630 [Cryptomeria japonica]
MAVGSAIIPVLLGVLMIICNYGSQIMAQQVYSGDSSEDCNNFHKESSGYLCNGAAKECQTFALYRAQQFYMSLDRVGSLFNTGPATIASASNLSVSNYSKSLDKDQAVLFPINCNCAGNFSQANLTYTAKDDDTYLKIASQTLEGLTTCQAMREQNPKVGENDLKTGTKLVAPLRCACPTRQQLDQGVKYLLSYIADVEDDDEIIPAKFDIRHEDFISANKLEDSNPTIFPYTTLLIPLDHTPTIPPKGPFAPPPPPRLPASPPLDLNSGPPPSSNSHTFVVILITSLAAALLVLAGFVIAIVLCLNRRKRRKVLKEAEAKRLEAAKIFKEPILMFRELSDLLESDRLIHYSLKELREATENFSEESRIEGSVFRGLLRGKRVAMKRMNGEVSKEINMLHKLHHANLVTLLGICLGHEEHHAYLVFEYAENGSLSNWIEDAGPRDSLPWKQRLQIAVDIAEGLERAVGTWRTGHGERFLSDEITDLLQGENAKENLSDWIDPNLQESYDLEVAFRIACIAKACVEKDLAFRPSMTEIRVELSGLAGISTDDSPLEWRIIPTFSSQFQPR